MQRREHRVAQLHRPCGQPPAVAGSLCNAVHGRVYRRLLVGPELQSPVSMKIDIAFAFRTT